MTPDRVFISRDNAEEDCVMRAPCPPEVVWKGRVQCGHCSTTHEPFDRRDTHPQCPWCGNLIDLTEYRASTQVASHMELVPP
jgi:hypothetical protein